MSTVPPAISPFSFGAQITEGLRTQVMCSSNEGDKPYHITWFKDLIPINPAAFPKIEIENKDVLSILSIVNLTSSDNGNYKCQISNIGGTVEYSAQLSVAGS